MSVLALPLALTPRPWLSLYSSDRLFPSLPPKPVPPADPGGGSTSAAAAAAAVVRGPTSSAAAAPDKGVPSPPPPPPPDLPSDLLHAVFSLLPAPALAAAARVCRSWHVAAYDPSLWRALCGATWPRSPLGRTCAWGSWRRMLRLRPQILTGGAYVLRQVCVRNVVGGAIAPVGAMPGGGGGGGSGGGDAALAAAAAVAAPDRVRLVIWYRFFVFEPAGRVTTLTTANVKGVMRRLERGNLPAIRDGGGGGSGGGSGGGGGGFGGGGVGGGEVCVGRWTLDEDAREVTLRVAGTGSRRFPVAAGATRVVAFVAAVSGFGACGWNRLELRRHFAVTGGAGGAGGLGGVDGAPDAEEEQSDFDLTNLSTRFRFVGWGGDARLAEVYPPVRGRRVTEEVEGEEVVAGG
ncbi:hypothetical protein I4F81_002371 [Pyropia yezoensis]|uniref:Uncharacterized protein n=1 Tax=Pyropia yezoensis TaxID=2788 RepID=A0ACC3BPM8_PYRYE|nr:hypothetical protein I4F81_002371 [Neopyropia yezoensis]